ncbi:MAG: UDP-glucose/GDP-mannose dehydrogenase family protein [Candidatus Eremiobacteraeota bacterium]|nr:UDP-glucose/GDP-mannose dehydrogenase family protein [Candidatus Eremiobacteraeota bacterium]
MNFPQGNGSPPKSTGSHRIAIVGTGYVGLVTGACFAELGHSVLCLDNDARKIGTLRLGELPFFEPQLHELVIHNRQAGRLTFSDDIAAGVRDRPIIFIAVGTPILPNDGVDLSQVCDVAATIGRELNGPKLVVVKSTVPVETGELVASIIAENSSQTHDVEVAANPEFLREGCAVDDFMRPDRIVIGATSEHARRTLQELYEPFGMPIVVTDVRTAEMIKYTANAFLATKVSFMNEIANICEIFNVDVKDVAHGIGLDQRIGSRFMRPGLGYGGSCFPKDVRGLERTAHGRGYEAQLIRTVEAVNQAQIVRTFHKIERALGSVEGRRVCVLGLAFKPDTSDVREAPALRLIELLTQAGATVTAHDPVAIDGARAITGDGVKYCSDIYGAINGCDVLVLATDWEEYAAIDFQLLRRLMRSNVVVDGRNLFDPDKVAAEGLRYIGVGRAREPVSLPARDEGMIPI